MVPFRKYASDEIASSFAPRILSVEFTLFEKEGRGEISPNSREKIPLRLFMSDVAPRLAQLNPDNAAAR